MSRASSVRAAIVGLGRWGQSLVTANEDFPESRLEFVAAATRTRSKAEAFCAARDLPLEDSFDAVLARPDVEAVVLATPHSQHCEQIRLAARAGKHVFVEKPLALTIADADSAVAAARGADIKLCVGFNRRFLPAFKALTELADSTKLGKPMHVEGAFSGPFGYGYTDEMWRGSTEENPAGGMAAMGIHILDAMISLMGPVKRVSALSKRLAVQSQLDDTTAVMIEFRSGATGSLSSLMATGSFWRLHVFGADGWAQMPDQTTLVTSDVAGKQEGRVFEPVNTLSYELDAFAGEVLGGADFPVALDQALIGVKAMAAIGESARREGAWISLDL